MTRNTTRPPLWSLPPWKWLFSLHVGLVLLVVVTIASIAGTFIPPIKAANGEVVVSALERSQALVYYNLWWYVPLLLLLALNITCATVRNVIERVLPQSRPRMMRGPRFYESVPSAGSVSYRGDATRVAETLRGRGYRVATEGECGHARSGMISRWGTPVAHLGFVIVLLGGFASKWFAREGVVRLNEGQTADQMTLRVQPPREIPLGFALRCEDFDTALFPKTNIPARYVSTLSVMAGERPRLTDRVEVNSALQVQGWTIHQTSCQPLEGLTRYLLSVVPEGRATTITLEVSPGQQRAIPGLTGDEIALGELAPPTGLTWKILRAGKPLQEGTLAFAGGDQPVRLRAEQFEPDFVIGEDGVGSRSDQLNNPALKVTVSRGAQRLASQWLFGREEFKSMMHAPKGPYLLDLKGVSGQAPHWQFEVTIKDAASGQDLGVYPLTLGREASVMPATAAPQADKPAAEKNEPGRWRVRAEKIVPAYATVLTLTRNPMIPVIYSGCALMLLGIALAFFIRRREAWFWVDAAGRRLHLAAVDRQSRGELEPKLRAVLNSLEDK